MLNVVRILHLSDLHYRESNKEVITRRVSVLLKTLENQKNKVDIVAFTGDLAHSGQVNEFAFAQKILIDNVRSRLSIAKNRMLLVPGNHDVFRGSIDVLKENQLLTEVGNNESAERCFKSQDKRLSNYNTFASSIMGKAEKPYKNSVLEINGLKVGISCLNSAWRCSGISDNNNLFLTESQVYDASKELDDCAIKICLMHHTLNLFHKSEQDTVINDLRRAYDIILTGHLHVPISLKEISPSFDSLILSSPSIYNTENKPLGFNIYEIDYEEKTVKVQFYKYMRKRDAFDRDTEEADNGEYIFKLNLSNESQYKNYVLCQKLSNTKSVTLTNIKNDLMVYQQIKDPIIVRPRIATVEWKGTKRSLNKYIGDFVDICNCNSVVYAQNDMGKSVFLQNLISDISESFSRGQGDRVGVYLDLEGRECKVIQLIELITRKLAEYGLGIDYENILVCVDHPPQNDFTQFGYINDIIVKHDNIKFVVALSNNLIFETLNKQNELVPWQTYEILNWGPSRIREFIKKYLEVNSSKIELDTAYDFIINSLKDSDLPSNPVIVSLYLSVIPVLQNKFSSISFIHLLEKIEHQRLESKGSLPQHAFYNKQEILAHLAYLCFLNENISVDYTAAVLYVQKYFDSKLLKVEAVPFIRELYKSHIIEVDGTLIRFKHYIFFDYYLARAFEKGIVSIETEFTNIYKYIELGKSLAIFCGIKRSYDSLIFKIIENVEPHFTERSNFTLVELDSYIHDLIEPINPDTTADEIAKIDINETIDYERMDEAYDNQKQEYAQEREFSAKFKEVTNDLEKLALKVSSLAVLYNCYRNLENINSDDKLLLLDSILDFHICCNLDLIKYFMKVIPHKDFQTAVAYSATIGGQAFLYDNIGNQSLELTFDFYLESCKNDFKKLLLICLMADLRLDDYALKLKAFAEETNSRAAIELLYFKTRDIITNYDSLKVPPNLISAFKAVFEKRSRLYKANEKKMLIDLKFTAELSTAKKEHLMNYKQHE